MPDHFQKKLVPSIDVREREARPNINLQLINLELSSYSPRAPVWVCFADVKKKALQYTVAARIITKVIV